MKKHTLRIVLLGAALAAFAMPSFTQAADDTPAPKTAPATRPSRRSFNPADMLKNYRDQFEGLNLSDDQMKKIDGFIETAEAAVKKAGDAKDRESRTAAFGAVNKLREDVNATLNDTQKGLLAHKRNADSVKRFKERYAVPELKLTDDQKAKLEAVYAEYESQLNTITPSTTSGPDREAFRKRGEMSRAAREKANAILTPDQQKLLPATRGRGRRGPTPPATTT